MSGTGRDDRIERDWPELTEWPDLMPTEISPDFVEQTCQRVFQDQRRIAEDASRVDEIELPGELLAAYVPPPPSLDFTDRVLANLQGEPGLPRLLREYSTPEPSDDFIERTLAALRMPADRSTSGHPRRFGLPARLMAVAAALVLALYLWPRSGTAETSAPAYSPARFATAVATRIREREAGAPHLHAADPLLLLATGALTEEPRQ